MSSSSRDILSTIGNTPLIELNNLESGGSTVYAKLEGANPSGSVKDRVALYIIEDAERRGLIAPGGMIVEATSGNLGAAFALPGCCPATSVAGG